MARPCNTLQRVKLFTSHVAFGRFQQELAEQPIGEIPRMVRTPYAYAPTHYVYDWAGVPVILCETSHKRYEVFRVAGQILPVEA